MSPDKQTTTKSTLNTSKRTPKGVLTSSDTCTSSPVIVPTPSSTNSLDPDPEDNGDILHSKMETAQEPGGGSSTALNAQQEKEVPTALDAGTEKSTSELSKVKKSNVKQEKKAKGKKSTRKVKKKKVVETSDEDSSDVEEDSESSEDDRKARKKKAAAKKKQLEKNKKVKMNTKTKSRKGKKKDESSDDTATEPSSTSDSESESETEKKKISKKKAAAKAKAKAKSKSKKPKNKKIDSSSEDSETEDSSSSSSSSSDSDSDSDSEPVTKRRSTKKRSKKSKKSKKNDTSSETSDSESTDEVAVAKDPVVVDATLTAPDLAISTGPTTEQIQEQITARQSEIQQLLVMAKSAGTTVPPPLPTIAVVEPKKKEKKGKKGKAEYKRVDQVWDSKLRDYKFTESAEEKKDEFDSVFTVRRKFNWENKYQYTLVDIKSHLLRDALQVILKDVKGQSLVEETPSVDPHLLFLYYKEIKTYYRTTLKKQLRKEKKKKQQKRITEQISHCKLLASYIDQDFSKTKKTLEPMLKAGNITFELIWALFKPNTITYTPTYGNKEDPRCFKVDYCYKDTDFMDQEWWTIEGRYLEYDGKKFGLGDHVVRIDHFKGTRKITSLTTFPLTYHKNEEALREQLIERGKKFVALQGMNYRFHKGLAYLKKKRAVAKININGRVMVDPAIFRRINPNYPLSYLKHKEDEGDSDEDEEDGCGCDSSDEEDEDYEPPTKVVVYKDRKGNMHLVEVAADDDGPDLQSQKLEALENAEENTTHTFTTEELLIASPVVLGFAFSEKLWLEFSLSGIAEIEWNSTAFDTLVLRSDIKQNLKGLVSSHRFNAARTIDDVIQGKGKGLNVVLHGPPGVGKTLTGESIADFLHCPLYAVSAGELGTNSRALEADLQRIMDITHSWGAILLLDEADVFLEQRQAQDIHRNSLVSVFLRLTEYYQGIMFMTTNRVATFDEAFQSRIHMGIRYEDLTSKARREIWMHHVRKIEALEDQECRPFEDADFDALSKKVLNGRQIKNTVITAQSIALAEESPFSIAHVTRVLSVAEDFENDMRGGSGYRDAMRQYT